MSTQEYVVERDEGRKGSEGSPSCVCVCGCFGCCVCALMCVLCSTVHVYGLLMRPNTCFFLSFFLFFFLSFLLSSSSPSSSGMQRRFVPSWTSLSTRAGEGQGTRRVYYRYVQERNLFMDYRYIGCQGCRGERYKCITCRVVLVLFQLMKYISRCESVCGASHNSHVYQSNGALCNVT